jgi:excisionase family DNA binding protein
MIGQERLLSADELAELLAVSADTVYRMCRVPEARGGVPRLRVGVLLRFERDAVMTWAREKAS